MKTICHFRMRAMTVLCNFKDIFNVCTEIVLERRNIIVALLFTLKGCFLLRMTYIFDTLNLKFLQSIVFDIPKFYLKYFLC